MGQKKKNGLYGILNVCFRSKLLEVKEQLHLESEFNLPPYTTTCMLSLHALGHINFENLESISDITAQKHASTSIYVNHFVARNNMQNVK